MSTTVTDQMTDQVAKLGRVHIGAPAAPEPRLFD